MTQYTKPESCASDMMWDAGLGGGGPWVQCSCGQEHTLPDSVTDDMYEHGEYESFEYIHLNGLDFVHGCEGCAKKLAQYESFIWNNRDHIRRYLKIRIDQEKAWADQEDLLNKSAGI